MDLSICTGNRQDASDGVVRGICFHNDRGVWNEVGKNGRSGECMLERIESTSTVLGKDPRGVFPGEPGKGDHDV